MHQNLDSHIGNSKGYQNEQSFHHHEPTFQSQPYSFKDVTQPDPNMLESFSKKFYESKKQHYHSQNLNTRLFDEASIPKLSYREQFQCELPQKTSAQEIKQLQSLVKSTENLESLLKNSNHNLLHPCSLLVNSIDKEKTELLVDHHSANKNNKSQIVCLNAKKYLRFLDSLDRKLERRGAATRSESNEWRRSSLTQNFKPRVLLHDVQSLPVNVKQEDNYEIRHQFVRKGDEFASTKERRSAGREGDSQYFQRPGFEEKQESYSRMVSSRATVENAFHSIETPQNLRTSNYRTEKPHYEVNFSPFPKNHQAKSSKSSRSHQSMNRSLSSQRKLNKGPTNHVKLGLNKQVKKVKIGRAQIQASGKKPNNSHRKESSEERNLAWKNVSQTNQFSKMLKMTSSHVRRT